MSVGKCLPMSTRSQPILRPISNMAAFCSGKSSASNDFLVSGSLLFREEFGQQQRLNRAAGRMPAGIAVTRFRRAQGQVLVQLVWAAALPMVLRDVDGHAYVLLHLLEQGFSLGKLARLKERPDGGCEEED